MTASYTVRMAEKLDMGMRAMAHHAGRRAVLYPNLYTWFVFASALDILLTHSIIQQLGGVEVNTIADWFIRTFDWWGAIVLKFATVLFVVGVCEVTGQRNFKAGRRLGIAAIALGFLPVTLGLTQIAGALFLDHGTLVAPDEFGGELPREITTPSTTLSPPKPARMK